MMPFSTIIQLAYTIGEIHSALVTLKTTQLNSILCFGFKGYGVDAALPYGPCSPKTHVSIYSVDVLLDALLPYSLRLYLLHAQSTVLSLSLINPVIF